MVAFPMSFWYKDSHQNMKSIGGVHEWPIFYFKLNEEIFQNFFGEEMGGVRRTQGPGRPTRDDHHDHDDLLKAFKGPSYH